MTHTTSPTDFGAWSPLPLTSIDEDLLVDATQRWQDCRSDMLTLMAGIPTVRSSINRLLQTDLQLDGERVMLQFSATEQRGRSLISLTDACLYLQQHPSLDTAQIPECNLLYLPAQHTLAQHTAAQLLNELKTLDLEQAIEDNWLRYWRTERAPNTPLTCLNRAIELYRIHFEASGEHLLAENKVHPEVLTPLFSLINPVAPTADAPKFCAEQLLLKRTGANTIALPGAWVLTLDTEQPVSQLVYLPTQAPAWHTFSRRLDLERWLLDRQTTLFAASDIDPLAIIEYKINNNPLEAGLNLWLKQLANQQYEDAIKPLAHVKLHDAYQASQHIDQRDVQRRAQALFAQAPEQPGTTVDAQVDSDLPQFGLLHNGIHASQRKVLIRQHRLALEKLLGSNTPTSPAWQSFEQQLNNLKVQQRAAEDAARAMLNRRHLDLAALNTHYSALYQARVQGLRIEANIQRTLDQITEAELLQITSALDTPKPDVMALMLSVKRPGDLQPTHTELNGPLVLLPPQAPQTPTNGSGTHFIYWPGNDGGLQRFASRQALEEGLFAIHPQDEVLALRFKPLTQAPFEYSLSSQQTAFEEQAASLRQTWSAPEQASRLASELEKLRKQTLPTLLLPNNMAREVAFLQLIEQHNSQVLAELLPEWLRTNTAENREAFKAMLPTYVRALKNAQALMERSLSPRDEFVRKTIDARLRKDFSLKQGFTLDLELPDSVVQKPNIFLDSLPNAPHILFDEPSAERSKVSLDALALQNLDSALSARLKFVSVEVTADDVNERDVLKAGVTERYLASTIRDLNLAQKYEDLIRQTFKGGPEESMHQKQYRHECLTEPLRLLLKMQGRLAVMQNHIDTGQLLLLNIAIDAATHAAWNIDGKRIRLLPAHLSAGGKDTNDESPITLSGITFIEEQNSGNTLLYLPEAPDERYLRGFTSLEQARIALFELCNLDSMATYVAGRAIKGDVRAHAARIGDASGKKYNAMIQAGFPWPATTSLAAYQLDAQMGRLIEANRNDARSNDDLANERYALKSGTLLLGIKIAVSFVPFVGAVVSLVDASTTMNQAVAAFRRGDTKQGLEQMISALQSLAQAVGDVAISAALPGPRGSAARQMTRAHQLKHLPGTSLWRSLKSRQGTTTRERFAGFEHPETIKAGNLQPVLTGPYRHTLRHNVSGDYFILSEGRYYRVRFDASIGKMRLIARNRYDSVVIELDPALQWDTYGALHGGRNTVYGGGSRRGGRGGGQPGSVPPAVNRELPASALEVNTQRATLGKNVITQHNDLVTQVDACTAKLRKHANDYPDPQVASTQRTTDSKALDVDLARDIESAKKMYTSLELAQQQQVRLPNFNYAVQLSKTAHIVSDRLNHLIHHATNRSVASFDRSMAIIQQLDNLPSASPITQTLLSEVRQCRLDILDDLNVIERSMKDMGTWSKRITARTARTEVAANLAYWKQRFTDLRITSMRSGQLLHPITRRQQTVDIDWIYQETAVNQARNNVSRALTAHMTLPEANISRVERNRILQNCIKVYEEFSRDLSAWNERSPDHFDPNFFQLMQKDLDRLIRKAERAIKKPASEPNPNATRTAFETEDGQLLIGTEKPAGQQSPRQFIISDADGNPTEVWDKIGDSNTYRLNLTQSQPAAAPPALPTDRRATLADARTRLDGVDAYEQQVRGYKTMEPINLEHRLVTEAKQLRTRANNVQSLDAGNPIVDQLRIRATALEQAGEALRIQRSLESPTPTEGYLDYLVGKGRVVIRKIGARKKLRDKRPDGKDDYLQEYEIYDSNRQAKADQPIWYAHFHYDALQSSFDSFPKAHLKLFAQRYLGMKWQAAAEGLAFVDTKIWRGSIEKPFARMHFQALK
ncbi:DUF6543 domain-containing protein [Pseudomonas sp. OST1909]|uniref:dermonecrotic toxin domain-containing protein n=1 Tax=Pseudomonas sp. OST1909 TaxID=2777367 RepID=UPI001889566B|nr:DUF6543 domain-containing protein [Pseudomonas sp. OST1909]QOY72777.1 hypothetical protein IH404_06910 [Pseudomonas sp. OST1909]